MTNAITLGFEADYGLENPEPFTILENIFCGIFTLELVLHFGVEGFRIYFSDRMNWLDFFLVTFSVLDVWVLKVLEVEADLKLMSVFRMLRLVRLARLLRLFRIFKELTLIVAGFIDSVRTLFWAVVFFSLSSTSLQSLPGRSLVQLWYALMARIRAMRRTRRLFFSTHSILRLATRGRSSAVLTNPC